MTADELLGQILLILPNAEIEQEADGNIIINTNLREDVSGELVEH